MSAVGRASRRWFPQPVAWTMAADAVALTIPAPLESADGASPSPGFTVPLPSAPAPVDHAEAEAPVAFGAVHVAALADVLRTLRALAEQLGAEARAWGDTDEGRQAMAGRMVELGGHIVAVSLRGLFLLRVARLMPSPLPVAVVDPGAAGRIGRALACEEDAWYGAGGNGSFMVRHLAAMVLAASVHGGAVEECASQIREAVDDAAEALGVRL